MHTPSRAQEEDVVGAVQEYAGSHGSGSMRKRPESKCFLANYATRICSMTAQRIDTRWRDYLALYWAQALAEQTQDTQLQAKFKPVNAAGDAPASDHTSQSGK